MLCVQQLWFRVASLVAKCVAVVIHRGVGGVAGPAGVLGVIGQLRGWLLARTGVLHWDAGDVGSHGESNLALVVRGWAKHRPKMPSMRHVLGKWRMSNPNRLEEKAGAHGQALPRGGSWFGAAR